MILGLQIGMLIAGLVALITGNIVFPEKIAVRGFAARLVGLLLLIPWPLAYAVGYAIGYYHGINRLRFVLAEWQFTLILLEAGITIGCLFVALLASVALTDDKQEAASLEEAPARPVGMSLGAWLAVGAAALGAGLVVLMMGLSWLLDSRPSNRPVEVRVTHGDPLAKGEEEPRRNPGDRWEVPKDKDIDKVGPKVEEVRPPEPGPIVLPALPDPVEIKPPGIRKETTVKLTGKVERLCVGGGGRFLVMRLERARPLAVFDANEGRVVREIDPGEEGTEFAAGMKYLVVYRPEAKRLVLFDLRTGKHTWATDRELPTGKVLSFCMGHASAGPVLVSVEGKDPVLFDPETGGEFGFPPPLLLDDLGPPLNARDHRYWVSADGRTYAHTEAAEHKGGIWMIRIRDGKTSRKSITGNPFYAVPGPDGRHVYACGYGEGVLSEHLRPAEGLDHSKPTYGAGTASCLYLPAHHGPYYLHAKTIDDSRGKGKEPLGTVRVFRLGQAEPIVAVTATAACPWDGEE